MEALDQETLDLFARTVRGVLGASGDDRTGDLEDSGWRDVLLTDARSVVPLVFRLQGELRSRTAVLDDVALEAMGPGAAERFDALGAAAYVHPTRAGSVPERRAAVAGQLEGSELTVDGIAFRVPRDGRLALLARVDDVTRLVVVPENALGRVAIEGMDPTLALARITGTVERGSRDVRQDVVPEVVEAACRRALAYELVGLGAAMLATTSEYAGARVQFGQPIGAFQAVKHRLADVLVALRAAEVVADESGGDARDVAPFGHGAGSPFGHGAGSPFGHGAVIATMAAKCLAGRAFRVAAENCLQVMGAIGFTLEHDLHHFIARGTVLDVLYGSARELRVELGRALVEQGRMPRPALP